MQENITNPEKIHIYPVSSWKSAEILELYRAAGWWEMGADPGEIPALIRGTYLFVVAVDARARAIGMGRLISDGVSDGYIQDVIVFPEYRNKGIGSRIVNLLKNLGRAHDLSWIGLIAAPGKTDFYKRAGFEPMQDFIPMKLD
ncbi:MAG TPA: GNAT family N-acetyltransferase [Methanocorpusculum sp.]|nr:GNAT family N-acetyltransferase [Methanocorpusculum sp.]